MSLFAKLSRGSIWVLLGKLGTAGLQAVTTILLARLLAPEAVGKVWVFISTTTIMAVFFSLGIPRILSRTVARGEPRSRKILVMSAGTIAILSLCILALTMLDDGAIASMLGLGTLPLLRIAILTGLFLTLFNLSLEYIRGTSNIPLAAIGRFIFRAMFVAGIVLSTLVWQQRDSYEHIAQLYLLSIAVAAVLFLGIAIYSNYERTLDEEPTERRKSFVSASLTVWLSSIMYVLSEQLGFTVVNNYASTEQVALFGIAVQLSLMLQMPLTLLIGTVPPYIAKYTRGDIQDKRELELTLRRLTTLYALPSLCILLVIIVASRPFLALVYGEFYGNASTMLIFLSIGQFASMFAGPSEVVLIMSGNDRDALICNATSSAFILLPITFVAANWGAVGVSLLIGLGIALNNVMNLLFIRKRLGMTIHFAPSLVTQLVSSQLNKHLLRT